MKAIWRKRGACLVPAEDEARDELAKITDGAEVVVGIHRPRDLSQLRRWWKLMEILAENMPVVTDKRMVSDLVLTAAGEVDWFVHPVTGETRPKVRSIAFESMKADAFDRLWKRAVYYITSEWLPIGSEKLQAEVDLFFSGAREASLGSKVVRTTREAA